MFWDWGSAQIGDMGSHMMDLVYSATDATLPTRIGATGEDYKPEVAPVELACHFDHPGNVWRGPIRISWQQGGLLPRTPRDFIDLDKSNSVSLPTVSAKRPNTTVPRAKSPITLKPTPCSNAITGRAGRSTADPTTS